MKAQIEPRKLSPNEIRARVVEIERELFEPSGYTQCNITSPDGAELDQAKIQRFELLGRERSELLSQLPAEGMASGQRIVIAKVLGDVRDWPEPKPEGDVEGPEDIWGWTHDEENLSDLRKE